MDAQAPSRMSRRNCRLAVLSSALLLLPWCLTGCGSSSGSSNNEEVTSTTSDSSNSPTSTFLAATTTTLDCPGNLFKITISLSGVDASSANYEQNLQQVLAQTCQTDERCVSFQGAAGRRLTASNATATVVVATELPQTEVEQQVSSPSFSTAACSKLGADATCSTSVIEIAVVTTTLTSTTVTTKTTVTMTTTTTKATAAGATTTEAAAAAATTAEAAATTVTTTTGAEATAAATTTAAAELTATTTTITTAEEAGTTTITLEATTTPLAATAAPPLERNASTDALFLMQASFGPTRKSLSELMAQPSYLSWIQQQMALPWGSHRAYYRSRVNPKTRLPDQNGVTATPSLAAQERSRCALGALWHRYAFTRADVGLAVTVNGTAIMVDGSLRSYIDSSYTGNGLTAPAGSCTDTVPSFQSSCTSGNLKWRCRWNPSWTPSQYCQQTCWDAGFGYDGTDCSGGWPAFSFTGYVCGVEESIGGLVWLDTRSSCNGGSNYDYKTMKNPAIWLSDSTLYTTSSGIFNQTDYSSETQMLWEAPSPCSHGEFISSGSLLYRHYPRLYLLENTLERPATEERTTGECIHATRNPINKASCRLEVNSCGSGLQQQNIHFNLTSAALSQIFQASGRYVYSVTGLSPQASPCQTLSRWVLCQVSDSCTASSLASGDAQAIQTALSGLSGDIRDITPLCSTTQVAAGAKVDVGGQLFRHVNLHEYSVYDFTNFRSQHPGGSGNIEKWATGSFGLQFPASHPMSRWVDNREVLIYVGTLGSSVSFAALPTELQTQEVALALFGSLASVPPYSWACGSPGEVASNPIKGLQFSMVLDYDTKYRSDRLDTPYYRNEPVRRLAKQTTWIMQALYGEDQLRQRVAWALSQIFVVGVPGLGMDAYNELWITYYDICVRGAFSNFRDLLLEVTLSPLMGRYLSFVRSYSFDHDGNYPDENYAREVMQLFSIGLWKLNPDGSYQTDENQNTIPTYTNEEIMDFARIFTGFNYRAVRPNVETPATVNLYDPMTVEAAKHDFYPKMDLNGGYIGDGYPLCADLPTQAFLAAGAVWELEGKLSIADMEVMNLTSGSALFTALCGAAAPPCSFQSEVTLASTLTCHGEECSAVAGSLKVVKVDIGFYRYRPQKCVNLYFFSEGKQSLEQGGPITWDSKRTCQNPGLPVAGVSCCKGCSNTATSSMQTNGITCESRTTSWFQNTARCVNSETWTDQSYCEVGCHGAGVGYPGRDCSLSYEEQRPCSFPRERMSFAQAQERCSAVGMTPCWKVTAAGCGYDQEDVMDVWLNDSCSVNISISSSGHVALLHTAKSSANPIRVAWTQGQFPVAATAPSSCSVLGGSATLQCSFQTSVQPVFTDVPTSAELSARLKVAAYPPSTACTHCSGEVKAYAPGGNVGDVATVFEYGGKFFKNAEALVKVGDFSFRNPPAFMVPSFPTEDDAMAEVEALLDHLSNHPNTPPFISRILIQRLVTSTPSPAYIAAVAEAFRTGTYDNVTFSGRYGDLGATTAAILLHPEARGRAANLTTTGKLREPVVKLMHVLRALEYTDHEGREVVMLGSGYISDMIGQFAHFAPHVFNFYTPDHRPVELPAGLYGPEFQIFTPPFMISWLNGVLDLIEKGLNSCDSGFGMTVPTCSNHLDYNGVLTLNSSSFSPATAQNIIDELSVLLTGGRLGPSEEVVRKAYDAAAEGEKVKAAQKAIVMSPEFHTLGSMEPSGTTTSRSHNSSTGSSSEDYKALVMLFLRGGADTFNLLVPLECDLTNEYLQVRTSVAIQPTAFIPITTTGQTCGSFGLHPELTYLQTLYNDGNMAFASNIGNLVEPLSAQQYRDGGGKYCSGLFSHADQVNAAQTLQCQSKSADVGFGGLMGDVLSSKGFSTSSFSIAGQSVWSSGYSTTPVVLSDKDGAVFFTRYDQDGDIAKNISENVLGNAYAETFNKKLWQGIETMQSLKATFEGANVTTVFDSEVSISRQLHQVARTISTRRARGAQRDLFYVELTGFDHHADEELALLGEKFQHLNAALQSFVTEMKRQGEWDNVVVASGSDFGRTLTSNGEGTDHAWAGNHFILGGKVNGARIYNPYPSSLLEGNDQDVGRGRLLPLYPLENMYAPIAEWLGVTGSDLTTPFRNLQNFNSSRDFIPMATLFQS